MNTEEELKKDDLIVDIDFNPDGKGKVGKALHDSVTRETYDYLINKGILSEQERCLKMIEENTIWMKIKPIDKNTIEVNGLKCEDWNIKIIQPEELTQKVREGK